MDHEPDSYRPDGSRENNRRRKVWFKTTPNS